MLFWPLCTELYEGRILFAETYRLKVWRLTISLLHFRGDVIKKYFLVWKYLYNFFLLFKINFYQCKYLKTFRIFVVFLMQSNILNSYRLVVISTPEKKKNTSKIFQLTQHTSKQTVRCVLGESSTWILKREILQFYLNWKRPTFRDLKSASL